MTSFWTTAVADSWEVFWGVAGDFLPVIALAVGLAIFGVVVGVFMNRGQ